MEHSKNKWKQPLTGKSKWLGLVALFALVLFVMIYVLIKASHEGEGGERLVFAALALIVVAFLVPLLIRLCRWLCCWRNLRRFLFAGACFITLLALVYVGEDWRGQRAWGKYKRAGEVRGEKFNVASIAPPSVPDEQNFAMQPIWVEEISGMMGMERAKTWYGDRAAALGHTNLIRSLEMPIDLYSRKLGNTNQTGNWQKAEQTDLKAWQDYYQRVAAVTNFYPTLSTPQTPAEDVLLALSKFDSTVEKLRAASRLPYARFPVCYDDDNPASILLPHLASLKSCALVLRLRAVAELQAGQAEKALNDVMLTLRLTEALRAEPILISHLVRISVLDIALQPVWEGLADHKWSETQLLTLDAELAKLDFLADYHLTIRAERTFGVHVIDYLRRNPSHIREVVGWTSFDDDKGWQSNQGEFQVGIFQFAPRGWFEQNKLSICRLSDDFFRPIINLDTRVFSRTSEARADTAILQLLAKRNPYELFARYFLRSMPTVSRKFVRSQTSTDLARLAIALERHRLAHGNYPETLDALVPQFIAKLPHDVINGQPLKYRRNADASFILYSVGWNEKDDGGTVVMTTGKTPSVDPKKGDWVWNSAAK